MTNWTTKKLGEVCNIISPEVRKFDGVKKYVATADVDFDRIISFTKINYINRPSRANVKVQKNDVFVARMAETKKFLVANKELQENYIFSTGFAVLRTKQDLIPKYLFYSLVTKEFNKQKDKLATGATQKAINNERLKRIKIPVPPIEIQQKIVERLDLIRKAQELNDKQIALANELFQSLLHKKLDPKGKNWEIKKLGEVTTDLLNGFPSRPVSENDGIPQFRPHNIDLDGTLVFKGIKFVPKRIKNLEKYFLKKDDVIFNNTNSIELVGKTTYIDKDYKIVFSNHLTRIRINSTKVSGYYLSTLLHFLYKREKFQTLCTPWVNQAAVNNTALKKLKFYLPSLATQRKIVEKLQAVQEYKKKLIEQKQKLKELFESCLDKAMKGELI